VSEKKTWYDTAVYNIARIAILAMLVAVIVRFSACVVQDLGKF